MERTTGVAEVEVIGANPIFAQNKQGRVMTKNSSFFFVGNKELQSIL
jgi:hypothetical protein